MDNEVVFSVNLSSEVNAGNISYLTKLLRGKCDRLIANFHCQTDMRFSFFRKNFFFFFPDEFWFLSLWEKSKISSWRLSFQSTKRKFVSNLNECYTQADRKVCEWIITNWLRCFHVDSCSSMVYVYSHEITDWIGDIAARLYILTEKTL